MKKNLLLGAALGSILCAASANAQTVVYEQETVTALGTVDCNPKYSTSARDNWFIQLGAGINTPLVEKELNNGDPKQHITATYNFGFGKWMSPYLGLRLGLNYSQIRWDNHVVSTAKTANANLDVMWDMFNSFHGVNTHRVFSIVPFVGLGGTFAWDYNAPASNIYGKDGKIKSNQWTMPVSAGIQLRFRLCSYADFFLEGRAGFYGDNFNNCAVDRPLDIDITALGGFSFNIGGSDFQTYSPCSDLAYINQLNGQINALRGELAETATALAVAQAQLPCPEAQTVVVEKIVEKPETKIVYRDVQGTPLMSTVRFTIGSSVISPEEMVNVYNVAEYLKANPNINVNVLGYADRDTGTAEFNQQLSVRRAEAVVKALEDYGISSSRLTPKGEGSTIQPYGTNSWNRIVVFQPTN